MATSACAGLELAALFVISISAVAIAFLYVSGIWIAAILWGRQFQALMLLGRNENLYA